jgi:hypothetical protein
MKKFLVSTVLPAFALLALNANATTLSNSGPLTISWKVTTQALTFSDTNEPVLSTNHTAKETNYISKYKATTKTDSFKNADLLELLGYSLSATFTNKGDALAVDDGGEIYVVNGANVVANVSPVLKFEFKDTLRSGAEAETVTVEKTGTTNIVVSTTTNGMSTETQMGYIELKYDDYGMTNVSLHSAFHVAGVATAAIDYNFGKNTGTENISLSSGAGSGEIRGTNSIITGSITASAKGTGGGD